MVDRNQVGGHEQEDVVRPSTCGVALLLHKGNVAQMSDWRSRAGLQAHAPEVCVPVVEGTDWVRVVIQVAQWGVKCVDECGRVGTDGLGRRADAQWVEHEQKERHPAKPGKESCVGSD